MIETLSDKLLDNYEYAEDPILKERLHGWDVESIRKMVWYGSGINKFGHQMMSSQNRVAKYGRDFMLSIGYSERAAKNFRAAMMFHDIGKTHPSFDPSIWVMEDRPSPEEKEQRRQHAKLGVAMTSEYAEENGIAEHPHIKVRLALTKYHHERVDGQGPERINALELPRFVQISCIVDAFDGDQIYRQHQPAQRTPEMAVRRMLSMDGESKYSGAFDEDLIRSFADFISKKYAFSYD
jgi:HD-GYP domain-containing protein (c-di-GMP phosphodiesterase class II)